MKTCREIPYWVCFLPCHGQFKYIASFDDNGRIIHTEDKKDAHKFIRMNDAGPYFNMGYTISKCYLIV